MRQRQALRNLWCLVFPCALTVPFPVLAREDASTLCLDAAAKAAGESGVPLDVLLAISVVETGRGDRPWPWTVNTAGEGQWFESLEEAEDYVAGVLDQGLTNVDLGCFQLNYRWHADAFASIADMLDPGRNATYAAEFLAQHFAETGDWAKAAAAYHSATPEYAEAYQAKFETVLADLAGGPPPDHPAPVRSNGFPLLVAGSTGRNGSLVPTTGGGSPLIGVP
ncbi:transglycosylase SLT domain-containing protein [Tabrizicola sp.]|uniref:transglycosylase SLT domain-containing protein n=1 Tax=Tabrizicola sp. TaxID=2005166 RepID=UPI003F33B57F